MPYLSLSYTDQFSIVYLEFKFHWVFCILYSYLLGRAMLFDGRCVPAKRKTGTLDVRRPTPTSRNHPDWAGGWGRKGASYRSMVLKGWSADENIINWELDRNENSPAPAQT